MQAHASLLKQRVCLSLSHGVFMEKTIAKRETNDFVFSIQRVSLFPPFHCRKIKEQIAERRNLLDIKLSFESIAFMKPVSIITSDIAKFRELVN